LDLDGDVEVMMINVGTSPKERFIGCWDLPYKYNPLAQEWPMHRHDMWSTGLYGFVVPPSPVSIDLVLDTTTVQRGGTLGFTVTVVNNTDSTKTVQVWTEATLPNGNPYPGNHVLGPRSVNLNPHQTISHRINHRVPNNAPLGKYKYSGKVGTYPSPNLDADSFTFTVVAGGEKGLRLREKMNEGWEVVEGW